MVERHSALRTTFDDAGGQLWQVHHEPGPVELPVTDLSDRPDRDAAIRDLAASFARERFDLYRGPLFRAAWCGWPMTTTDCYWSGTT